jgi:type IV pilus assembly protein PilB
MNNFEAPIFDAASGKLSGIGRALVLAGNLDQKTAETLFSKAHAQGKSFVSELVGSGAVSSFTLAHTLCKAFISPLVDLDAVDIEKLPSDLLDGKICRDYQLLPLTKRNNALVIATADPSNREAAEKIKFATQLSVEWVVVEFDKLMKLSTLRYGETSEQSNTAKLSSGFDEKSLESAEDSNTFESNLDSEVGDAPVVRFLRKMLSDAYALGASDLHFEPYESSYRVRFRIDGVLREIAAPPISIKEKLASRIKVISRIDISEKRVPQDGRMKMKIGPDKVIDFRVSTLPTLFGEKIVIRILDPSSAQMGIEALGYEDVEKERLLKAINRPYGMVLVTGPTGSGKTISLYTCLNILNRPGVNIATAEDPSEINVPGINQVNVNEKAGLTFAVALRSFLRQDPDIIMVGEIRDLETADISIKAAQTGHMVMSTLHTNDAPSTITRLRNMGVAPFNIASSVILVTAQRLARRLCLKCKVTIDLPRQALLDAGYQESDLDGTWKPYHAVGCNSCSNGFKGRVGIYQVMPVSDEIQRIILRDGSALDIAEQAEREGVRSLRTSGLHKVRLGLTSIAEVMAVTNE